MLDTAFTASKQIRQLMAAAVLGRASSCAHPVGNAHSIISEARSVADLMESGRVTDRPPDRFLVPMVSAARKRRSSGGVRAPSRAVIPDLEAFGETESAAGM